MMTTSQAILVRTIKQKDNTAFTIEWSDGAICNYRLSDLQKHCPCASCIDEVSGKCLIDETKLKADVRAVRIASVGRYALRVQFTSGCSTGIYTFDMLRKMSGDKQ